VFCQTCGALNPDERELCVRCHQKLLVLSGSLGDEGGDEGEELEEEVSFDEHLLERISLVEEAVKRTAEMMRQVLEGLRRQEKNILINGTGLEALQEILEQKRLLTRDEWSDLWERRMNDELAALDRRDGFVAVRDRIQALFSGERRELFVQHLDEAENWFSQLDIPRALEALEAAWRLDRGNLALGFFLGESYFNAGAAERALPFFEGVLSGDPTHYQGLVYSGVIHHERGETERAEELLKRSVALYPDAFLPCFTLGAINARRGHLRLAVEYLERAVAVEAVPQALYLLGSALYEMGRPTAAIDRLKEAVRRDPTFEEAHHLLGLAYLERRWNRKALEAFRQAQRLNPRKMRYGDVVGYLSGSGAMPLPEVTGQAAEEFARAEERLAEDDLEGAADAYRRALSEAPDNPTLLLSYAMLCLELDRTRELETVSRKVLELAPGEMLEATACAALIEALRSQGRFREGNRIGEDLLEESGSSFSKTIAYYEMAYNLAEMEEDLDRALDYARRSLEHAPDELEAFPLAALGWIHYKRREYDEAVDFLSKSSEIAPSSTTLTHLGMALLASGQEAEAREVLARARGLTDRGDRGDALGAKMMDLMKDSARLLEGVRQPSGG
jgi:tetratricopeptide (TPR) repeat protein